MSYILPSVPNNLNWQTSTDRSIYDITEFELAESSSVSDYFSVEIIKADHGNENPFLERVGWTGGVEFLISAYPYHLLAMGVTELVIQAKKTSTSTPVVVGTDTYVGSLNIGNQTQNAISPEEIDGLLNQQFPPEADLSIRLSLLDFIDGNVITSISDKKILDLNKEMETGYYRSPFVSYHSQDVIDLNFITAETEDESIEVLGSNISSPSHHRGPATKENPDRLFAPFQPELAVKSDSNNKTTSNFLAEPSYLQNILNSNYTQTTYNQVQPSLISKNEVLQGIIDVRARGSVTEKFGPNVYESKSSLPDRVLIPNIASIGFNVIPRSTALYAPIYHSGAGYEFTISAIADDGIKIRKRVSSENSITSLPQSATYHFENQSVIPRISASALTNNIVKISVSNVSAAGSIQYESEAYIGQTQNHYGSSNNQWRFSDENILQEINVFRRKISAKPEKDNYSRVYFATYNSQFGTGMGQDNQGNQTMIGNSGDFHFEDIVEPNSAYKYICIFRCLSSLAQGFSPLFTSVGYKTPDYEYGTQGHLQINTVQSKHNVRINIENIPSNIKKLMVFEASSLTGRKAKKLIETYALSGKLKKNITLTRRNISHRQQNLEYSITAINRHGIEYPIGNVSNLVFNQPDPGDLKPLITGFEASYSLNANAVTMSGTIKVRDLFTAQNTNELSNPSETTIKAAQNRLKIVKLMITRIDKNTDVREIIFNEIINPGLKITGGSSSDLASPNTITFEFIDNNTNAEIYEYSPISQNTEYIYEVRPIIYPLSLAIVNATQFHSITIENPEVLQDRLPYRYNPSIFDHPLNTELGILPANGSSGTPLSSNLIDAIAKSDTSVVSTVTTAVPSNPQNAFFADTVLDSRLEPVTKLVIRIQSGLHHYKLDHIKIMASYDTANGKECIDRIHAIPDTYGFTTVYYDYAARNLACNKIIYSIIGIGMDFEEVFSMSAPAIDLQSPFSKKATRRVDALKFGKLVPAQTLNEEGP